MGGWRRDDYGILQPIARMDGWISPRLCVRFGVTSGEALRPYHASGEPFLTFQEITDERDRERQARLSAESERDRLAARLRALGIDPDSV